LIDDWWRRHFGRLLQREQAGEDPKRLAGRWLVLASLTWKNRRRHVSFAVPDHIYHVLDDADVRAKDKGYAEGQWALAREWLNG
jgi:hypothetical protein